MYDIIINPLGGKGNSIKTLAEVKKILSEKNIEYHIHKTEYAGHATEIAKQLSAVPDTKIIVLGGDGSFHEVLCGIENFDNIILGIVACGSGNDFIKKSGHPSDVRGAMDVILKGESKYYDFIDLGNYRCLNVAGTGMDVDVLLKYQNVKKLKGSAAYLYALLYTLLHTRFHKLRLTIDGKASEHTVFMIGVGNGAFFGGGMPICPNAEPDDGILNIVVVNKFSRWIYPFMLIKFLRGKIINSKYTKEYNTKEVKIEALDDITKIELDGEIIDDKVLNCKIVSNKLRIFR